MEKKKYLLWLGCFLFCGALVLSLPGAEVDGKEILEFSRVEYSDLPEGLQSWVDSSRRQQIAQSKNFQGHTYILVTYGEKPTGGYRVEIKELRRDEEKIDVLVEFQAPAPGQMVTQAFTYPYDLVRIPETEIPVQFTATGEKEHIMELRGTDRILSIVASSDWIKVFSPAPEKEVEKELLVKGMASTFEGNILYRLIDSGGEEIKNGFTTAGMGDWYYFEIELSLEGLLKPGEKFTLELYTKSAKDGSVENLVSISLRLGK